MFWEEGSDLVPSESGIHHLWAYMGFLLDLTRVKTACSQRLQGEILFNRHMEGETSLFLEHIL